MEAKKVDPEETSNGLGMTALFDLQPAVPRCTVQGYKSEDQRNNTLQTLLKLELKWPNP